MADDHRNRNVPAIFLWFDEFPIALNESTDIIIVHFCLLMHFLTMQNNVVFLVVRNECEIISYSFGLMSIK